MYIITGSSALNFHGLPFRKAKDVDVLSDSPNPKHPRMRFDVIEIPTYLLDKVPHICFHATEDAVYTIKCSHLPWDIKWDKHARDVLYLKKMGCKLIPDLYDAFTAHWKKVNGNKEFLSLKQAKSDFFDDNVTYLYDHDYLHELMAYPNAPMYRKALKEGEDVLIDKDKFDILPFEDQVRMFREEIGVIACERWLINPANKGKFNLTQAWALSVKKTVTALTKGWASEFLVQHLEHFIKPNRGNFNHIFNTLQIGDVTMTDRLSKEEVNVLMEEMIEAYIGEACKCGEDFPVSSFQHEALADGDYTFGTFEHIKQEGGGEGGSEDCYSIFKWKDQHYRMEYSYYSYDGYDFDYVEFYKVTPTEKLVTVYV